MATRENIRLIARTSSITKHIGFAVVRFCPFLWLVRVRGMYDVEFAQRGEKSGNPELECKNGVARILLPCIEGLNWNQSISRLSRFGIA